MTVLLLSVGRATGIEGARGRGRPMKQAFLEADYCRWGELERNDPGDLPSSTVLRTAVSYVEGNRRKFEEHHEVGGVEVHLLRYVVNSAFEGIIDIRRFSERESDRSHSLSCCVIFLSSDEGVF